MSSHEVSKNRTSGAQFGNTGEGRPTGTEPSGAHGPSRAAPDVPAAKDPHNTVAPKRRLPTQSCQFKGRPGGAPALTSIEDGATAMVAPPDNAAFAVRDPCGYQGRAS